MYIAFITGLVSSLHCLGMCGPIALALPTRSTINAVLYNLGRIITYSVLGVIFGLFGKGLYLAGIQQPLSIGLGVAVIGMVFLPKIRLAFVDRFTIRLRKWFTPFFQRKTSVAMFMIGILNGLLPCGMVYIALLGALAMSGPVAGAGYMVLFGLGTLPMMLAVGLSKKLFKPSFSLKINKFIPVLTLCIGMLFIVRGMNLGIAYLSPKAERQTKTITCCKPVPVAKK
jgi:sulfite exporter TauE/SafE